MQQTWRDTLTEYWKEERATGKVGFPTREEVVAHCLVRWAENISLFPCPNRDDCHGCNIDFGIWWEWMGSLSRGTRVAVQSVMRKCEIPFPPGPYEELPHDALFTPLN